MKRVLLLAISVLMVGCGQNNVKTDEIDIEDCNKARNKFIISYLRFFKTDDINEILYVFDDSKPVVSLEETKLTEAYRFVWLRSMQGSIMITVTIRGKRADLNLRATKDSGCYADQLIENKTFRLTDEQLAHLKQIIQENPFWQKNIPYELGADGSDWIIEVKQGEHYHRSKQWTPKEGDIWNIGSYLLELSDYDADADHFL